MTPQELFQDAAIAKTAPVKLALLKGPLYSESADLWAVMTAYEAQVRTYFDQIGVQVIISTNGGYAYLDQVGEDHPGYSLPKLFRKHQYTFETTVIGAAIREEMLRRESSRMEDAATVLSMEDIVGLIQAFLKIRADAAKERGRWEEKIRAFGRMGFLRPVNGDTERFEVRPIIRAKFNVETLAALKEILQRHANKPAAASE